MRTIIPLLLALLLTPCTAAHAANARPNAPLAFEIHAAGHLIVPARINGQPVFLVVDTGAGGTVIDEKAAGALGLEISTPAERSAIGAGGAGMEIRTSEGNRFELAGTTDAGFTLRVMDLAHVVKALSTTERPISGVVGHDWLEAHGAVISYADRTIRATR